MSVRSWIVPLALLGVAAPVCSQEPAVAAGEIDALFEGYNDTTPGAAVIVVRDGRVLFRAGYGMADLEHGVGIGPETVFDIASVSKQFTGLAIATLVEAGTIDLDADIREYIPEVPDLGAPITVRHLVHHTSGIRDWPATLALAGWRMDDVIAFDQILRMVWNQRDLNFAPGSEYSYSNTGYNLLAELVERVSGQSLREWTQRHVFGPLGMSSTHFQDDHQELVPRRALGYHAAGADGFRTVFNGLTAYGSSSLFGSVEDIARWVINFDEHTVGGPTVVDRMRTRGRLNDGERIAYAFGISHGTYRGLETWSHSGSWAGFRSYLLHVPEERFGVVVLSNYGRFDPTRRAYRIADLYLAERLDPPTPVASEAPDPSTPAAAVPITTMDEYVGTYRLGPGWLLTISRSGAQLMAQATNEAMFPTNAVSQTEFWVPAYGASVHFRRDERGVISSIDYRGIHAPRIEPWEPTGAELAEYAGTYESEELDTRYRLLVRDGALVASHLRHGEFAVRPEVPDEFSGEAWFFRGVRFVRDASGAVREMFVGTGRSRNQRFVKR